MDIKRENWRGRYVVTIRDRGRLVSWRKYSSKITLKRYGSHFKQNDYYEARHFWWWFFYGYMFCVIYVAVYKSFFI